uniref:DUF4834 domain-containing protein n=1 Tax=Strongyloides papillosus TaxID=174720 RepID=A0A0N5BAI7_STREA
MALYVYCLIIILYWIYALLFNVIQKIYIKVMLYGKYFEKTFRKKNICSSENSSGQKSSSRFAKIRNLLQLFKKKDSCQIPDDDFMEEKDSNLLVNENDDTN